LKKGPPRAIPGERDCNISKRGCQAFKKNKFHKIPGTWHENIFTIFLASFGNRWVVPRRSIWSKNALGFDMARFVFCLTWRFFAKSPTKTLFFERLKIARCGDTARETGCEF